MRGTFTRTAIAVVGLYITACTPAESPNQSPSVTAADSPEPATTSATAEAVPNVTPYSPAVGREYPTDVYFGDTHLHTSISLDAYGDGNSKIGPDEAYRFAKGETVIGDDGMAKIVKADLIA